MNTLGSVETPCPFCGGRLLWDADGGLPCVVHTLPACRTFMQAPGDALAFAKLCNLEVARRRGVGIS